MGEQKRFFNMGDMGYKDNMGIDIGTDNKDKVDSMVDYKRLNQASFLPSPLKMDHQKSPVLQTHVQIHHQILFQILHHNLIDSDSYVPSSLS